MNKKVTYRFDSLEAAAEALLVVMLEARLGDSVFRFGGLTAAELFSSGLRLDGDIEAVAAKVDQIAGAVDEEQDSGEADPQG